MIERVAFFWADGRVESLEVDTNRRGVHLRAPTPFDVLDGDSRRPMMHAIAFERLEFGYRSRGYAPRSFWVYAQTPTLPRPACYAEREQLIGRIDAGARAAFALGCFIALLDTAGSA